MASNGNNSEKLQNGKAMNATVLIVDDEEIYRQVIREMLENEGYRVEEAANSQETLAVMAAKAPDLILLDVVMPQMDGYKVCALIKEEKKYSHIPVIFVTALDSAEDEAKGFAMGGVDYISKPVRLPTLLARVRAHVELKKKRDRLEGQNIKLTRAAMELEKELEWRDGLEERLNELGYLDGYEGIFSRRIFMHMAENYLRLAERFRCRLFLLYVGIDNIKTLQESQGAEGYEQAIADTVTILRNTFRQSDICLFGFFGDGELVSLLLSSADTGDDHPAISRLYDAVEGYNDDPHRESPLAISIGAVHYGYDEPFALEELIDRGRTAMLTSRLQKDQE